MQNIKKRKSFLSIIVIFLVSFFWFRESFSYFFFQDDWFVLNWGRTGNIASFFEFRTDIIYWRPLSLPLFFWLGNYLFGLNPFFFHWIVFGFFCILILALYKFYLIFFKDKNLSILCVLLYGIWPVHFISLSWIAAFQYILAPLLLLLSFINFVYYIENRRKFFLVLGFIFYLTGVISHEMTFVLPLILLAWAILYKKKKYLILIVHLAAIALILMLFRLINAPIGAKGDYQIFIGGKTLLSFIWYILWSFNIPESFRELVDPRLAVLSFAFLKQFWWITLSCGVMMVLSISTLFLHFKQDARSYFFAFLWFVLSLFPFLLVPSHMFPMYLSFAGVGFIYGLGLVMMRSNYILTFSILILWIFSSYFNLQFARSTHWVINEQAVSKAYVDYVKNKVIDPSDNSLFLVRNTHLYFSQKHNFELFMSEGVIRQSLNDDLAFKVIYNNDSLRVRYVNEDFRIGSEEVKVYEIWPRCETSDCEKIF